MLVKSTLSQFKIVSGIKYLAIAALLVLPIAELGTEQHPDS